MVLHFIRIKNTYFHDLQSLVLAVLIKINRLIGFDAALIKKNITLPLQSCKLFFSIAAYLATENVHFKILTKNLKVLLF